MSKEPQDLIEQNGYIYKLMRSKEEQLKSDEEAEAKLERNFKAFRAKIGGELYDYLHDQKAIVKYISGGNYSSTTYFDFYNNLTWAEYEYDTSEKKHFGETDWYLYDGSLNNNFASAPVYKAIADWLLHKVDGVSRSKEEKVAK
jgi:hypothetical protein